MKKQTLKKPFFSNFLENQLDKSTEPEIQGGRPTNPQLDVVVTNKYPSDADEYVTHKYPSDSDEAVTQKFPSDGDDDLSPLEPLQP